MGFFTELRRRHVVKVAIVYVTVGFAVLQGADLLLPTMNVPDWTFRVIVAVVLLGFPVAMVVAWAFEVSPAGVERTRATPAGEEAVPEEGSAYAPVAASVRTVSEHSLAVLPFANLSGSTDNEYFSDGITEEILTVLSKVRGLEVISRTSVMRFKGSAKGIVEIADELRVAHVVEGSVRRHGERVRITAQLVDARTDHHLWAETYDRDLDDIFAIQTDVAERIVESLKVAITPAERARLESRPTESVEAYQWFLRGRQLLAQRTGVSLQRAIEAFDHALEKDPDFALAWAHRGDAFGLLPNYAATDLEESVSKARGSARRALEIDPGLGEAHAALGIAAQTAWEWEEAERQLQRALALAPGYAPAHHWYALILIRRGRFDEAIGKLERALELDPLSSPLHMVLGTAQMYAGRSGEAERTLRRALEFEPSSVPLHTNLAAVLEITGRYDEALDEMETVARLAPEWMPAELAREMRAGLEEEGEAGYWRAMLEVLRENPLRTMEAVMALVQLGRVDEAMEVLEQAVDERKLNVPLNLWDPMMEPLRSHPRYPALLERIGLV